MNIKEFGDCDESTTLEQITSVLATIPYVRHLGIRVVKVEGARGVVLQLPFEARLVGNVTLPAIHGGVVATFMQVGALSATLARISGERLPEIVDFSIDYLRSAGPLDVYAHCEVFRVGRRIAVVGIRCWQLDPDAPIGLGRAHLFVGSSSSDPKVQ